MSDFEKAIAPKSDQLNADDLIGGKTMDIVVTDVKINLKSDQKVIIHYEGDNGKPFKPCKTVSRVLMSCWGNPQIHSYKGRKMRLFCDPKVRYAGESVGGIRVSHLSNIEKDSIVPVTQSRGRRTAYKVKAFIDKVVDKLDAKQEQEKRIKDSAKNCVQSISATTDAENLAEVMDKLADDLETIKSFSEPAYNHVMSKHTEKQESFTLDETPDDEEVVPI